MTKNIRGLTLLSLGVMAAYATADTIMVPRGTDVKLAFAERLNSNTTKEGETITMQVKEPVFVNGKLAIPSGTMVTAVVDNVEKHGRFGKNAVVELTFNPIMVNGTVVQLQNRQKGLRFQGGNTGTAAAASGAGFLALGPLGLLAGYGVVGKPVDIKPGHLVATQTSETVALNLPS